MIKVGITHLNHGKSIVFDATNPTKEKRIEYINEIKSRFNNVEFYCIHLNTSMEESITRNKLRNKIIPNIAYFKFRKNFEIPTTKELFKCVWTV